MEVNTASVLVLTFTPFDPDAESSQRGAVQCVGILSWNGKENLGLLLISPSSYCFITILDSVLPMLLLL